MAKGHKRAPPPRQKQEKRPTRVWDRLELQLPRRSIERDLRIILQHIAGRGASILHSSHDTSDDVPGNGALPHFEGRRPVQHSWAKPLALAAAAAAPQQEQWRSRSSSPSFQFPALSEQAAAAVHPAQPALLHPGIGPAGPAAKYGVGPVSLPVSLPTSDNSQGTTLVGGGLAWGAYSALIHQAVGARYTAQATFA